MSVNSDQLSIISYKLIKSDKNLSGKINKAINLDQIIDVPEEQYVLDIADENGIKLPSGCLQGECSSCLAKLVSGEVDQSEQKFLQPSEIAAGYTVTCVKDISNN